MSNRKFETINRWSNKPTGAKYDVYDAVSACVRNAESDRDGARTDDHAYEKALALGEGLGRLMQILSDNGLLKDEEVLSVLGELRGDFQITEQF